MTDLLDYDFIVKVNHYYFLLIDYACSAYTCWQKIYLASIAIKQNLIRERINKYPFLAYDSL